MKKHMILAVVILHSISLLAQSRDDTLLINDSFFDVKTEISDKWQNESAIILAQKTVLIIEKVDDVKVYDESWVTRTKILLQDKAAVEYWSDFTTTTHDYFGMKIIKSNGDVIEIDTNQFIPVSEGVVSSSFSINESTDRVDYKKLAIEQLEIGDIIDYTYQTLDKNYAEPHMSYFPLRRENTWNNFISYTYAFGSRYPKLKQDFILKLDPSLYFTVRGINGLGQPKEETLANGMKQLSIRVENLDREPSDYFTNSEVSNPKMKIEIAYAQPYRYYRTPLLLGQQGENSKELNVESLKRALFMDFHSSSFDPNSDLYTYEDDPVDALNDLYAKYQKLIYNGESSDYTQGSYFTAYNLYHSLSKRFDAEILVCLPKTNGSLDDLAITTDIIFAVRVKTNDGGYHYAYNFYKHTSIDDWDSRIVGTEAYAFKPTKRYRKFELNRVELPDYTPEHNRYYVKSEIELDIESGISNVNSTTQLSGETRGRYAEDLINIDDFGYDLRIKFLDFKLLRFYSRMVEKGEARRVEHMKGWIEDDFNVTEYESFELNKTGFEPENNILEFEESYAIDDLFKIAGKAENEYVVVDVGRTITGQIALLDKDRDRKTDIIVDYQKQFHYDVNIQIPEGYSVKNLENLNYNVKTEAGRFTASAEIVNEDGKSLLKITSIKSYTNTFLPKEKWTEMEQFLDAAFEFSQQKIVLVKN